MPTIIEPPRMSRIDEPPEKPGVIFRIHHDARKLASAIQQTIELTLDDLAHGKQKKPKVDSTITTYAGHPNIKITTRYYKYIPRYKDVFRITLRPASVDPRYYNDLERQHDNGDSCSGFIAIPLKPEQTDLAAVLSEQILADITAQISTGLRKNHAYMLDGKVRKSIELERTIRGHLDHKLAAAFGGALHLDHKKPLVLAQMNEDEAEQQFRREMNALMKAGSSDHYLLQTFGVQAGVRAGADASIIAEWQIGRTLELPATLDKIRHISDTLELFLQNDMQARADNAGTLLRQIRSLQNTASRDLEALSIEAASIHSAKTLMRAHEGMLQKYVQGFHHRRQTLSEIFGEAAVARREVALRTTLSAAQIHTANQESIHERLTLRMIDQISDFTTRLSFLTQSMQQIVTETTLQTLLPEGRSVGDMEHDILRSAGISPVAQQRYKDMDAHQLSLSIREKTEQILDHLAPITSAALEIEHDLVTAELREQKLLPAPNTPEEPENI